MECLRVLVLALCFFLLIFYLSSPNYTQPWNELPLLIYSVSRQMCDFSNLTAKILGDSCWNSVFSVSVVSSKLDYCNILLSGRLRTRTESVKIAQNAAARILTKTRKIWPYDTNFNFPFLAPYTCQIRLKGASGDLQNCKWACQFISVWFH